MDRLSLGEFIIRFFIYLFYDTLKLSNNKNKNTILDNSSCGNLLRTCLVLQ